MSRNKYSLARLLNRNSNSARYASRCLADSQWYEPMIDRFSNDHSGSIVLV